MNAKTQQRTLIHEDKDKLNAMLKDVNEMMPILKRVQSTYNDLEIGKLNDHVFQEILRNGTAKIKRDYMAHEEDQIKKAGITSTRLQKNMMNGADEVFEKFNTQVKLLKEFHAPRYGVDTHPRLPKKYIHCFENGTFGVLKEHQEQILEEYCREYLQGAEMHELHQLLAQEFLGAFEKVKKNLNKLGFIYDGDLKSIERHFIKYEGGDATIKPTSIRYAVSGQKEQAEARKRNRRETRQFHREMSAPTLNELAENNE